MSQKAMKKLFKKTSSLILLIAVTLFNLSPLMAFGADFNTFSTISSGGLVTASDYGTIGQQLRGKQEGPAVKIIFSKNIAKSSSMSATAVTSGFSDLKDKLYFTWYLKKNGCDLKKNVGDGNKCDLDGDHNITPNDWKIAAVRSLIKGEFDASAESYTNKDPNKVIEDDSSQKAIPNWEYTWGGVNNKDDSNCYIQDTKSGNFFELRKSGDSSINDCPTGYHIACVKDIPMNETISCYVPGDEAATKVRQDEWKSKNTDTVNKCSATDNSKNPPATPTSEEILNCEVAAGMPANYNPTKGSKMNVCQEVSVEKRDMKCDVTKTELKDIINFHVDVVCNDDNQIAACVADNNGGLSLNNANGKVLAHILGKDASLFDNGGDINIAGTKINYDSTSKEQMCGTGLSASTLVPGILNKQINNNINTPVFGSYYAGKNVLNDQQNYGNSSSNCRGILNSIASGGNDADGISIKQDKNIQGSCSFKRGENVCKHLFPKLPKTITILETDKEGNEFERKLDLSDTKSGDGEMTIAEKEFWGADPTTNSTNGKQKDQTVIMGKGIDVFSWTYSVGDKVGVAVEGTSLLPTEHVDSTYKIVWALPGGTCNKLEGLSEEGSDTYGIDRAFYTEEKSGTKVGILTADVDIDECLKDEENLIEPEDQGLNKIQINVTTNPDNPINDPNGRGDIVIASALVANADSSGMSYQWRIEKSLDGSMFPSDETKWVDITNKFANKDLTEGIGNSKFKFNLDLTKIILDSGIESSKNQGTYYLRVKAAANEHSGESSQSGKGISKPIKVYFQKNQILIYPVKANIDGELSLNEGTKSLPTELTDLECDSVACYVTKNQIVGVKVTNITEDQEELGNFSWKINGNDFNCVGSSQCSNGNVLFFPVLGNVGEAVDVVAKATNLKTNERVEVSKHFVIVNPGASITSEDESILWPKIVGYYMDATGRPTIPDFSSSVFEGQNGKTVKMRARFYPAAIGGQVGYSWTVDGDIQDNSSPELALALTKQVGESYSINLTETMASDAKQQAIWQKNALRNYWGVGIDDTSEINNNANIQINVLNAANLATDTKNTSMAASLITHLPQQLMFLFKLFLTGATLMLLTGLIFTIMPANTYQRNEN